MVGRKWRRRFRLLASGDRDIRREMFATAYTRRAVRQVLRYLTPVKRPSQWMFLLGCYNSGTTILREMLASHPEISGLIKEGVRFTDVFKRPDDIGWNRNWLYCRDYVSLPPRKDEDLANRLIRDWSPLWDGRKRIFLEKSISNIERIGWIESNLENVFFLGIIRNGYVAAKGMQKKSAPQGEKVKSYGSSKYSLETTIEQWAMANRHMLTSLKSVRKAKIITYEELTDDPVNVINDIFSWLGISELAESDVQGLVCIGSRKFDIRNMNEGTLAKMQAGEFEVMNASGREMLAELNYLKEK